MPSKLRMMLNLKSKAQNSISYHVQQKLSPNDRSLVDSGMMMAPRSAQYTPNAEGAANAYTNLMDLIGIKGWATNQVVEAFGFQPNNLKAPQIARSGEMDTAARSIRDANMGDLLGLRRCPEESGWNNV